VWWAGTETASHCTWRSQEKFKQDLEFYEVEPKRTTIVEGLSHEILKYILLGQKQNQNL
jgi:hypothetical protein